MRRFIALVFLFLAACGSGDAIIGDKAEFVGPNPSGNKKGLTYEKATNGDLVVYANAVHKKQGAIEGGYRVNLYFVNEGAQPITISPEPTLTSANGVMLKPLDYPSFMNLAYGLQSATPPPMPEYRDQDRRISGTAFDQYGNHYSFNATSSARLSSGEQFSRGFEQGYAAGEAIVAMATVKIGRDLTNWGEDYYIRPKYTLQSGEKVLATAYFRKLKASSEQLNLNIKLGKKTLTF